MTGLARRGVREHRRYARELLRERFAMYLYTIEIRVRTLYLRRTLIVPG